MPDVFDIGMKFLTLKTYDAYLNLAIEEYLFNTETDDIFMLWQNSPSIIIGKNQNAFAEINREFIQNSDIKIARRITGGGAVYHDLGNVNYTFISDKSENGLDFTYFTKPITDALAEIGLKATLTGRNDLMTYDGKKISGNAQHTNGKRVLHHGTLLFDTNLDILTSALKVDEDKIKSKAIKSIRSRVGNIKEIINSSLNVTEFINLISDYIIKTYNPEVISQPDNEFIQRLYARNSSPEWIFPEKEYLSSYTVLKKKRYDFGTVQCNLTMKNQIISDIRIEGDFFENKPVCELEENIKGYPIEELKAKVFSRLNVSDYIFGMTTNDFLSLINS